MSLFDNASETNLRACAQMVEDVLERRGVAAAGARVPHGDGPAWRLLHGSAEIFVFLTP